MRVSPGAWLSSSIEDAARFARQTALPSHGHHHGVRGAVSVAVAVRMALEGLSKDEIKRVIEDRFGYNLSIHPDEIRPTYYFHVSCQKSVPQALSCFFAGDSFEECVRLAISLGGDADTQAAISGFVAEAMFGPPKHLGDYAIEHLKPEMKAVHTYLRAAVAGKKFEKTDPARVLRDLTPPREGEDPMADPFVAENLAKIKVATDHIRTCSRRSAKEGSFCLLCVSSKSANSDDLGVLYAEQWSSQLTSRYARKLGVDQIHSSV